MTVYDDCCDFCGAFLDLMGCDTATRVGEDNLWDGQCKEGLRAIYGHIPDAKLKEAANRLQAAYDADPIDWNHYPEDNTPEAFQRHARRLRVRRGASRLQAALRLRNGQDLDDGKLAAFLAKQKEKEDGTESKG